MSAAAAIPDLPDVALPFERWNQRLFTAVGVALDSTILRAMQLVVDAALMPPPEELPGLLASAELLLEPELQREPRRFFAFLDEPLPPHEVTGHIRRRLEGGTVIAREIDYRYQPHGFSTGESAREERILLEHWVHTSGAGAGTVIAIHGFSMGWPRIDAVALLARQWFAQGLDVVLLTLPQHGARTPPSARFSGEAFAVPDVSRLSEAVRQAIYELRLVSHWLRDSTAAPVGLLGLSLGGYLSALMAGLSDELDFVVPMVSPVCVGDLAWRFFTRSRHYRKGASPAFSQPQLRILFRIHSPLAHPLRLARERVLIVAGRGDRIVPPEHPHALWEHWGRPSIHWFSGSHLAPFGRQRIVAEVVRHLRWLDVL
jgi:pimeloyl-ACP methyl ester carboxylesterase